MEHSNTTPRKVAFLLNVELRIFIQFNNLSNVQKRWRSFWTFQVLQFNNPSNDSV